MGKCPLHHQPMIDHRRRPGTRIESRQHACWRPPRSWHSHCPSPASAVTLGCSFRKRRACTRLRADARGPPQRADSGSSMCGILAALGVTGDAEKNRRDILKLSRLLRHRGPDQNSVYQAPDGRAFLAFERLMIVDPTETGRRAPQPPALCACAGHALSHMHAAAAACWQLPPPTVAPAARPARLQAAVPDTHPRGQHRLGTVSPKQALPCCHPGCLHHAAGRRRC